MYQTYLLIKYSIKDLLKVLHVGLSLIFSGNLFQTLTNWCLKFILITSILRNGDIRLGAARVLWECWPIPNIVLFRVLQKTYKKCITIYVLRVSLYKSCTTIENSKLCTQVVHYYLFFCSTSFHVIMYDVIQPTYYFEK